MPIWTSGLQQLGKPGRCAGGAVSLHGDVVDLPVDLGCQQGCQGVLGEGGREPTLDDRDVRDRQVPAQLVHVASVLDALDRPRLRR